VPQSTARPPLIGAAAAYDRRRGTAVVFGGSDSSRLDTDLTWVLDDRDWTLRSPIVRPPPRSGATLTYDATRGRSVLFGGSNNFGLLDDTWEWDGVAWTDRTPISPAISPPARVGAASAYDAARGVVVLHGGFGTAATVDDTWEWDGTTWTERTGAPRPAKRAGHAMIYDERRARIVMFGGTDDTAFTTTWFADTWELDGAWHPVTPAASPPGRGAHGMAYDPQRGEVVVHGGRRVAQLDDTWRFDGVRWYRLTTSGSAGPRVDHVFVYHETRGAIVLVGGDQVAARTEWTLRWEGGTYDTCAAAIDRDLDQLAGCADPDCWAICTPMCLPESTCAPGSPRCGDGTCDPIETCRSCASDCPCPARCGDAHCDPPETLASCPGDCTP
jgi:hypothetical protein